MEAAYLKAWGLAPVWKLEDEDRRINSAPVLCSQLPAPSS
jgi:hypothetical protein